MNSSFQRTSGSDEWYTPLELINALGEFDLDPCSPEGICWPTARTLFTKADNGLKKQWFGRVWLNPPYSRELFQAFVRKLVQHGNGVLLCFARTDTQFMQNEVFPYADSVFFFKGRIKFYNADGTQGGSAGAPSMLVAFGQENTAAILKSGIEGAMMYRD